MDHRPGIQRRWRTDHPVMTQQAMKLGYIGLGNMGAPMARRLV
ncbi:NAD(P)-dependent oxidoreductase, partial [Mycobacteroides abscessus]